MPNLWTLTPITVDGLDLSSHAYGIVAKTKTFGAKRAADQILPGMDGVSASLNDDFEPSLLTLTMYVRGTDPATGTIPGGSNSVAEVRKNVDTLAFAFSKTHALLDVREEVDGLGTIHQAYAKVVQAIEPEMVAGSSGEFAVILEIPDVFWQDVNSVDWFSTPTLVSGNSYEVTTLQGATAPIGNAVVTFTGPATNPQLTDLTTGGYVRLNAALTAGQVWRFNCATWSTRYATGLVLESVDETGTDAQAVTVTGGSKATFLRLQPQISNGARRVFLTVGGTGFTSATAVGVRARRKYLH